MTDINCDNYFISDYTCRYDYTGDEILTIISFSLKKKFKDKSKHLCPVKFGVLAYKKTQ